MLILQLRGLAAERLAALGNSFCSWELDTCIDQNILTHLLKKIFSSKGPDALAVFQSL